MLSSAVALILISVSFILARGSTDIKGSETVDYARLMRWGNQHGIKVEAFDVGDFVVDNGIAVLNVRGARATKDIEIGDVLISVPRSMMLTSASVSRRWPKIFHHEALKEIVDTFKKNKQIALLSYCTWLERTAGASGDVRANERENAVVDMSPFLKLLPKQAKQVEIDDQEIAQMQCHNHQWCSTLASMTKNQIQYIEDAYDVMQRSFARHADASFTESFLPSFMDFVDVYTVVNSRAYSAEGMNKGPNALKEDRPETVAVVPLADFFNHHDHIHNESSFRYDPVSERFVVKADRAYRKGEQVFIRYGRLNSAYLVHHYSFVLPDNAYEHIKVAVSEVAHAPMASTVSSMLRRWKVELLQDLARLSDDGSGTSGSEYIKIDARGVPSAEGIAALRIRALTEHDVYGGDGRHGEERSEPIELLRRLAKDLRESEVNPSAAKERGLHRLTDLEFGLSNEITVWREYVRWAVNRLTRMSTSLEDDIEKVKRIRSTLMENGERAFDSVKRKWLFVIQRVEEKRVLHRSILYGLERIDAAYGRYIDCDVADSEIKRACDSWNAERIVWREHLRDWNKALDDAWDYIRGN